MLKKRKVETLRESAFKVRYVGLPQCNDSNELGGLYLRNYARHRHRRFTPVDPRRSFRSNGTDSSFSVTMHSARQRPNGTPFPPLRDPRVGVLRLHRRVDWTKKRGVAKRSKIRALRFDGPTVYSASGSLSLEAGPLVTRIPW